MHRHRAGLWIAVASLAVFVVSTVTPPYAARAAAADKPEVDYKTDVVYGTGGGEELKLDLATPKGLDHAVPAIVVIHGGGWSAGNRTDMALFAKEAAAHGYVGATISYRLAPKHHFPAQIEDVKCAVRYLRAHADELKIDPKRIGAMGVSAGAHLALILGTMDPADGLEGDGGNTDQSSKVQAVVSIVGPVNLVGEFPEISNRIIEVFLGGKPADKQDECRRASPITYVNKGDAPMLLFFGTKDPLVPYDQAFQMTTALTNAAVPARVEMLVGASHGWGGKELERTLKESMSFFDAQLTK
jgi:acetyl esterase/lipase